MVNSKVYWEKMGEQVLNGENDINSASIDATTIKELTNYRSKTEVRHLFSKVNFDAKTLLDLGCGTGRLTFAFAKKCKKVIGVDLSGNFIKIANMQKTKKNIKNIEFYSSALQELEIKQKFDIVHSGGVFMYISDNDIKEIIKYIQKNLLKKDGILITRETISFTGITFKSEHSFIRTDDDYLKLFENTTFKLIYENETFPICPIMKIYRYTPERLRTNFTISRIFRFLFSLQALIDPILLKFRVSYKPIFEKSWHHKQKFYIFRKVGLK